MLIDNCDPSWRHVRYYKKCGPNRFKRFNVYWINTNKKICLNNKLLTKYLLLLAGSEVVLDVEGLPDLLRGLTLQVVQVSSVELGIVTENKRNFS